MFSTKLFCTPPCTNFQIHLRAMEVLNIPFYTWNTQYQLEYQNLILNLIYIHSRRYTFVVPYGIEKMNKKRIMMWRIVHQNFNKLTNLASFCFVVQEVVHCIPFHHFMHITTIYGTMTCRLSIKSLMTYILIV